MVAPVVVTDDAVTPVGADNPVVTEIGGEDEEPFGFPADTTILNPLPPDNGGLNVRGGVVPVVVIGGPPSSGYAVIV